MFVAVNDHKTGEAFSVEVPDGERALHVFDHPRVRGTASLADRRLQQRVTATPR